MLLDAVDTVVIVRSEYKCFSLEVNLFFVLMCLFLYLCNIFVVGEVSEQIRNRMKVLCFHLNLILVKSFLYDKPW